MSRNDFGLKFGAQEQFYGNVPDGRQAMLPNVENHSAQDH